MPFKKGHTTNLGRKLSDETRKKMSEAHKETKPSKWGAGFKKGDIPWNNRLSVARNAYYAGFFDADGSVSIAKKNEIKGRVYYGVVVQFSARADKGSSLEEGKLMWGGSLRKRPPRKNNHNWVLQWKMYAKDAEKFLEDIFPFVKLKRKQVALAIKFRWFKKRKKQNRPIPIDEKEWDLRKQMVDEMKRLNS